MQTDPADVMQAVPPNPHEENIMASTTFSGPVTSTNGFIGTITTAPVAVTTSTATVTSAYAGKAIYLNRAAGVTVTLPAATGTGNVYTFVLAATATGNQIVKVANTSDTMIGAAHVISDNSAAVLGLSLIHI